MRNSRTNMPRSFEPAPANGPTGPAPPPDAPSPFALADPDRVRSILAVAGFADIELDGTTAGMWFGNDADDANQFVLGLMGWILEGLDDARRAQALDNLRISFAAHDSGRGVFYESATWTINAI